ncbi:hypothetical protein KEM48_010268 [Puccinia striiformis f. sp. tritici PST-130]|nr:hypothetical protein KEM48_010268 [Puccinia striiformis f. sp. tritici PST-130]
MAPLNGQGHPDPIHPNSTSTTSCSSNGDNTIKPMIIGLQGPQGIGTRLTRHHDLNLAIQVFDSLSKVNETKEVLLPVYDKSAHHGLGDRTEFNKLSLPAEHVIRLVIFEGWMLGFVPLDPLQLRRTYDHLLELDPPSDTFITQFSVHELLTINLNLSAYHQLIWPRIDVLINLVPQDLNFIWQWRIQQENEMKAKNGGSVVMDEGRKAVNVDPKGKETGPLSELKP